MTSLQSVSNWESTAYGVLGTLISPLIRQETALASVQAPGIGHRQKLIAIFSYYDRVCYSDDKLLKWRSIGVRNGDSSRGCGCP